MSSVASKARILCRGAMAKGSAAVAAQEAAPKAAAEGPVVKAPAPSSESELDIMVED